MKILFWTGYNSPLYDGDTQTGLGGTEVGIINVSKGLAAYGHKVTISGQVKNSGMVDNVEWIDIDSFMAKYSTKENYFDIVIGVNYIHFLKYMYIANQNNSKKLFWVHNTDYYKWFEGVELSSEECNILLDSVDVVITPSHWALEDSQKWYASEERPRKAIGAAIQNGINTEVFANTNVKKDPNKFIWSSATDRGLSTLLKNWPRIKSVMPNATLDVYYPEYSNPHIPERDSWYNIEGVANLLEELKDLGVSDMGSVAQDKLHYAMLKATYWMYLTDYKETFCITALEMMAAGVLPICSNKAALGGLVTDGIVIEYQDVETMYDIAIQTLGMLNVELKEKAVDAAKEKSKKYTWRNVSKSWHNLVTSIHKPLAEVTL